MPVHTATRTPRAKSADPADIGRRRGPAHTPRVSAVTLAEPWVYVAVECGRHRVGPCRRAQARLAWNPGHFGAPARRTEVARALLLPTREADRCDRSSCSPRSRRAPAPAAPHRDR